MRAVYFKAIPFVKDEVLLALESGVTGLLVPGDEALLAANLARCAVVAAEDAVAITLAGRDDEDRAAAAMSAGDLVILGAGWEIIPVENLLARAGNKGTGRLFLEVATAEEATLAVGILEKGVDGVVVAPAALPRLKAIVAAVATEGLTLPLVEAVITEIRPVGMGHRVCVDTLSRLRTGQGMLVGNSAAFTFLVNAETEHNEYVASRPFRINAGAVHAYAVMPGDRTKYLEELRAGDDVLVVGAAGETERAVVGRVKVEKRPMLLVRAVCGEAEGAVFLQNAETIRLVTPGGGSVSVVALKPGDTVLCRPDTVGRHFGIRITEDITEA